MKELDVVAKNYNKLVAGRLKNAIKKMEIEQAELAKRCREQGFAMSPSKLNKMMNSGSGMQISSVAAICETLGLDMNEVLSTNPNQEIKIHLVSHEKPVYKNPPQLIKNPNAREFERYMGLYHIVFNQTKSGEKGHHVGTMELKHSDDESFCEVIVSIPITNDDGEKFEKKYKGNAVISTRMKSLYISVESEALGEIVFINITYMYLNYTDLKCRVGAVVTTSTGDNHMPTMEKIIIIRKETEDEILSERILDFFDGELRLNSSDILIAADDYDRFLRELNEGPESGDTDPISKCMYNWIKYRDEFKNMILSSTGDDTIPGIQPRLYYSIPESRIRESQMSNLAIAQVLSRLRFYSSARKHSKVSRKADERVYLLFKEWKKALNAIAFEDKQDKRSESDIESL